MENKPVDTKRGRKVGLDREIGIAMCTLCVCVVSCFSCVWLFVTLWTTYSPPYSSVHGSLLARILKWIAMPSSRRSSLPRDWNCISYDSNINRRLLYCQHHLGSPIYTLLCINIIKQVANENPLYSTSNLPCALWWPKWGRNLNKRGKCICITHSLSCTVEMNTL